MTDADQSIAGKRHHRIMQVVEIAFGVSCFATLIVAEVLAWGLTTATAAMLGLGAGIPIKRFSDMGRKV